MATESTRLPAAFPPWMREADPLLAGEETNGLFQAFRARRAGLRPGPLRGYGFVILLIPLSAIPMLLWWSARPTPSHMVPLLIATVVVVWFGFLAEEGHRWPTASWMRGRLPLSVGEMVGDTSLAPGSQPAADLWLVPMAGRDVAEAIYLEHREATLLALPWYRIGIGTVAVPIWWFILWQFPGDTGARLLSGAALWLAIHIGLGAMAEGAGVQASRRHVERIVAGWNMADPQRRLKADPRITDRETAMLIVAFLVVPIPVIAWIYIFAEPVRATGFFLLVAAALFVARRARRRRPVPGDFSAVLADADRFFPAWWHDRLDPEAHPFPVMAPISSAFVAPAFPPWLREADPLLAAEDTNGPFQAFRARRARLPWHRRGFPRVLLAPVLALWFAECLGVGNLGAAVVVSAVLVALRAVSAVRDTAGLPHYLGDLFGLRANARLRTPAATELFAGPIGGAEVVEALYLERREFLLRRHPLTDGLVAALLTLLLAEPLPDLLDRPLWELGAWVSLWLLWRQCMTIFLMRYHGHFVVVGLVPMVQRWARAVHGREVEVLPGYSPSHQVLAGCAQVALVTALLTCVGVVSVPVHAPFDFWRILDVPPEWRVALFLGLAAVAAFVAREFAPHGPTPDLAPLASQAERYFPRFLRTVVDPDG